MLLKEGQAVYGSKGKAYGPFAGRVVQMTRPTGDKHRSKQLILNCDQSKEAKGGFHTEQIRI
ncbi:hypothetical protein O9H85_09965 [Paenibacillus filicis]|uniref:KOW domain-containing protein n=1 Tax=Paenibacillus gyeongsangnamensis TaxID=3388067 RepID=A0ABT4Q788_9BACL|nr:hypothetical protein [Paenibacillus filicis]MCZ8512734.1 hypothetical protein [Paenibacillus filicis]